MCKCDALKAENEKEGTGKAETLQSPGVFLALDSPYRKGGEEFPVSPEMQCFPSPELTGPVMDLHPEEQN